ncbi:bile acid:sodium symporter family protein [Aliikangiella marina]|uniref:Bile acid:sodium symporter family protein n=1 Tax=Aliikangiella marina TaxID=1712262 RepID=A0A545TH82_9GAMM|nr:bile acid:sodium symporter family protein [Aliikangiella marina]TQV76590.1 bile acid:sodium symporter family protein [Aliikangiella marina]
MQASVLTQLVLPSCLFIIMLGMGLSLVMNDFSRVFKSPKAILIGLLGQLILLPVCGFIIVILLIDDPLLAMGIMLLAACPGGTTSNLVTHLAKGDLALSISLTAFSSVLALLTIPLIVGFSIEYFLSQTGEIQLDLSRTLSTLFLITLLPVSIGMIIRRLYLKLAIFLEPRIKSFSTIFLILLIAGIAFEQRETLLDAIVRSGLATLLLNLISMLVGFYLAKLFQLNSRQTISITIEIGLQNAALAMLVATTILGNTLIAVPAAVYSLVMYFTGGCIIAMSLRKLKVNTKKQPKTIVTHSD